MVATEIGLQKTSDTTSETLFFCLQRQATALILKELLKRTENLQEYCAWEVVPDGWMVGWNMVKGC